MKIEAHRLMHQPGVGLEVTFETDVERNVLHDLWKNGELRTSCDRFYIGHPCPSTKRPNQD